MLNSNMCLATGFYSIHVHVLEVHVIDLVAHSESCWYIISLVSSVTRYAQYLKELYQSPLPEKSKLFMTPNKEYIDLVVINRKHVTHAEADEFTKKCLHGKMNEILDIKTPIALEDILKPEEESPRAVVRCVLIEGAPGVGKSALAWSVCHKWYHTWEELQIMKQYELVVLVQLIEKRAQKARCLGDLLPHHENTNMEELLAAIGSGEKMLIVCDGFDELPRQQRQEDSTYIKLIQRSLLPKATVIVTSRPSVSADFWRVCQNRIDKHLEILGFTKKYINEYLESRFRDDTLNHFFSYITSNPPIYGMMYIPLNAIIITHAFNYDKENPTTMTQLCDALTRALIRRHLISTKQVPPDFDIPRSLQCIEDICQLPPKVAQQLKVLAVVACNGLLKNTYVFTLGEGFEHLGMMKKATRLDPLVGSVRSFNFLHLTLQEYLAVLYFAFHPRSGFTLVVPQSLCDRETVRTFLQGLCGQPDSKLLYRAASKAEEKELQEELSRQLSQTQGRKTTEPEEELQIKQMEMAERHAKRFRKF